MRKRLLSLLLTIITTLSLLPQLITPVYAAYENTYKNTGDQRADIIGVALTQVGYLEGSGNNNKNKYSEYFGYGARSWCGDFVSWCARQANIPKSILQNSGRARPSGFGITTVYESGYTPKPGDLFFKKDYGHVGLVYYVSGKYFYTIEGNTWDSSPRKDGVYIRKRLISDFYFGVPNYEGSSGGSSSSGGSTACQHSYTTNHDSAHPHKEYKICSKCSDKTYTGKEVTVSSCKTCAQENCVHKYSDWEKTSSTKHKKVCSSCQKTVTESHSWTSYIITVEPTCSTTGLKVRTCKYCNAEESKKLSATGEHAIDDIEYIDKNYHGQTCLDCGKVIKSRHTVTKEWTADGKNHWHYCTDCGERYDLNLHSYTEGCGSPCKTCGYISPFIHELPDTYTNDAQSHWKTCQQCNEAIGVDSHSYTSDCDETCNVCGYVRQVTTAHILQYQTDENSHWQFCTICGIEQIHVAHDPDLEAKDWENQCCLNCRIVLRAAELHEHTYATTDYDRQTHWGTCACGAQIQPESHQYNENNICAVCLAKNSPIGAQYKTDRYLVYGAAGFLGIVVIMIFTLIIRGLRKRRY